MFIVGYRKATAPKLPPAAPWLPRTQSALVATAASACRVLIAGDVLSVDEAAESTHRWLTSPLFRNALDDAGVGVADDDAAAGTAATATATSTSSLAVDSTAHARFIKDLLDGKKHCEASHYFSAFRKRDKETVFPNAGGKHGTRAHRAVLAALLKHNGLVVSRPPFQPQPQRERHSLTHKLHHRLTLSSLAAFEVDAHQWRVPACGASGASRVASGTMWR